jgi:hypothetical protein
MAVAYPKNVDGPFYVEDGCCTLCGVPKGIAPTLFSWDNGESCYVSRQPATASESDQMAEVQASAEFGCVRYRGSDVAVLRRLAENDLAELCDVAPPADAQPIERDHVSFLSPATRDIQALAAELRAYLHQRYARDNWRVKSGWLRSREVVRFSWHQDRFHTVRFTAIGQRPDYWLAWHATAASGGGRAVSRLLHEWLTSSDRHEDIRWFSAAQWRAGEAGQERPS